MNTRLVNTAAGVIMAALTQNRTPAGIALALDSAQMLLTPEMTAELARLQARVAELEEQLLALQGQRETLRGRSEPAGGVEDVTPQVVKLRSLLAGQRAAVDGEHYAAVHHDYRVSHDLPELGGAQ